MCDLSPLRMFQGSPRGGWFLLAWTTLVVAAPAAAAAQQVRGTVVAAATGLPIAQARVSISMEDGSARDVVGLTTFDGTFMLLAPRPGAVRVHVEQFGYRAWSSEVTEIARGEEVEFRIELHARALQLDAIEVRVTARGDEFGRSQFERRRAANESDRVTFLDPAHIALADARGPSDLFRGVTGILLEHDDRMTPQIGRCILYFLDHIRLPVMAVRANPRLMAFGGVDRLSQIVSQREIRGIEVYPSFSAVPSELRSSYRGVDVMQFRCALVQIWTTIGW